MGTASRPPSAVRFGRERVQLQHRSEPPTAGARDAVFALAVAREVSDESAGSQLLDPLDYSARGASRNC